MHYIQSYSVESYVHYIGPIVRNRNLWFLLHRDRHTYIHPLYLLVKKTKVIKTNDDGVSKFVKEKSENSRPYFFGEN